MSRGRRIYLYSVAFFGLVVSLVSLLLFLWRFVGEQAAALLGATPLRGALASPALPWLVVFVLSLATWLFHIVVANQAARPLTMVGAAERAAPARKMYLYMGRLAVVAALVVQVWLLIREVVTAFLDNGMAGLRAASAWPLGLAVGALVALGYYIYLRIEAAHDGDLGQERGRAVLWRRAYTYLAALVGALLAFVGGGELIRVGIRVLMTPLSGDTTWHRPAGAALAALVVGLALGATAWGAANRAATMNPSAETNALSRVLLRYAGIFVATLVTLVSLGYLIEQIILQAISRPAGAAGRALLGLFDWPWALAYLPVAALTWISFSNAVRTDALWGGERRRTAGIRRVVRYLLTGLSLAAFWYGLTEFAGLILQVLLGADTSTVSAAEWVQRFATSAAFLLLGAPAWWGHWWSQQMRVRTEANEIVAGAGTPGAPLVGERASLVRRVYLVAVILVGAVVVVAAVGFAAFLALNWQAASRLGGVRAAVAAAGAAALVALFWTLVHALTLRSDLRFLGRFRNEAQEEGPAAAPLVPAVAAAGFGGNGAALPLPSTPGPVAPPPVGPRLVPVPPSSVLAVTPAEPEAMSEVSFEEAAMESREYRREDLAPVAAQVGLRAREDFRPPYALAVIDGGDGVIGARLLAALEAAYPGVVLWPFGLNEAAHQAMRAALMGEEAPAAPEGALDQVAAVLAPSDVLIPGGLGGQVTPELAHALASSSARIILLPPRDVRLKWVAAPNWPLERWVENAVVEAGNALEAERQ